MTCTAMPVFYFTVCGQFESFFNSFVCLLFGHCRVSLILILFLVGKPHTHWHCYADSITVTSREIGYGITSTNGR
ncbi:MAG: hypothetical protein LBJ00_05085 [Planctomycetaceae bacterium]|nr:hypothetical protein [Planctomycetaceae bacterium]